MMQTNGDWLRSLDDDTLADVLGGLSLCSYIQDACGKWCAQRERCSGCVASWLKQPHEAVARGRM